MSAPKCIAFYGVRLDIHQDEISGLEDRSDARLIAARKHGLKHYWGNFGPLDERWFLFIGAKLGILGVEHEFRVDADEEMLLRVISETNTKLQQAGFDSQPGLYLQWQE